MALTRAVEGMIVIRKEKDSIFDEIGLSTAKIGEIKVAEQEGEKMRGEIRQNAVTLHHYGTQERAKAEEEEEKDFQALLFGSALHYTLEMMVAFDHSALSKALVSMQNRYGQQLDSAQMSEIASRIERLIENEAFLEMLSGATVSKERAFAYRGELRQVDLLLEYGDHSLVIDYKSSKKYHLKHQSQVQGYKHALAKLTNKPTKGMILYLLEESVEFVEI